MVHPSSRFWGDQSKVKRSSVFFAVVGDNVNANATHSIVAHGDQAVIAWADPGNREDAEVVSGGSFDHFVILNQDRAHPAYVDRAAVEFVNLVHSSDQGSIFCQAYRMVLHAGCRSSLRGKEGKTVGSIQCGGVTRTLLGDKPPVDAELQIGSKVTNPVEVDGSLVFDRLNQQFLRHSKLDRFGVVDGVEAKSKESVFAEADQRVRTLLDVGKSEIAVRIRSGLREHTATGEQVDGDFGCVDFRSAENATLQQTIVSE